jgi:hypothetical protein
MLYILPVASNVSRQVMACQYPTFLVSDRIENVMLVTSLFSSSLGFPPLDITSHESVFCHMSGHAGSRDRVWLYWDEQLMGILRH